MSARRQRLVVLGLSLSSSWGNGHATTYRSLLRGLASLDVDTLFLERDVAWYAANRDLTSPDYCRLGLYSSVADLERYDAEIAAADAVMIGSYVPEGIAIWRKVKATARGLKVFYDIDTPITLASVDDGTCEFLERSAIPEFDLYLSFTGGPMLRRIERCYGARMARELYCSVDPASYRPLRMPRRWALGYLGTYSPDRQPALERLLIEPARRAPGLQFVVAGSQYPDGIAWPVNVQRIEHLPPNQHAGFYNSLGWALNLTRERMITSGFSPSVRLFEAAACGAPIISDRWPGLESFFAPGAEIAIAESAEDVLAVLGSPQSDRDAVADAARRRVLECHSGAVRARQLAAHMEEACSAY